MILSCDTNFVGISMRMKFFYRINTRGVLGTKKYIMFYKKVSNLYEMTGQDLI